jgi:HlyD family secretion protein
VIYRADISAGVKPFAFLAIVCCLTLTNGCKKAAEDTPAAEVAVQAEKVAQGDLTEYITGSTVLSPVAQAAIVPKISAPVQRFLVQRGAHVHKGQLLAVLENGDLSAAVQDTHGSLAQADAAYATTTGAQVPEDRKRAQLDVEQAKANLDLAKTVYEARASLFKQGAIPQRDADTAHASLVQAQSAYDIAEQHLNALNSVSQAATLHSAQGALESAKGKYQAAAAGLSYSEIRSPIDGVVTDRPLFAGEMANAGQAIVTVMDTSSLIAKVHLSQEQVASLKVGDDAVANAAGMDEPVHGKLTLISPAVDQGSTTIEVWVTIPNEEGELKAGTSVKVSIAGQTLHNVITVPNEALVPTKSGGQAVMVIGTDMIAHQKTVKTGITDGKDTQALSGVQVGEQVVTDGAYGMDDGTKVKIGAADDAPAAEDDKKPDAGKGDQ